ncbi:MAG: ABC transporter ATP-binding protein [Planctomycetes bacterium]|nr:ABC transporter ATP-binding protein [Planctomycetota bacterium]
MPDPEKKKKPSLPNAWREAKELIFANRWRLVVGLGLIFINSLSGLVLPWSAQPLVDRVVDRQEYDLLPIIAIAAGIAVLVQAASSFGLSQLLSIAAQRAVTDMRMRVQAHVNRLPVRYFDSVQSGQLISRIMTDAEGIRNLVGTGLVQLIGGLITAIVAMGVLIHLNWHLTVITVIVLIIFGGACAFAFTRLRPLFRERGKINAEVTGRLGESLGAIRVVKAYVAEEREEQVFREGAERLFRNVAQSITGVSGMTALTTVTVGIVGVSMIMMGGHSMIAEFAHAGTGMTKGQFFQYLIFTGLVAAPVVQMASIGTQITDAFAGLDRIREIRRMATEEEEHGGRDAAGILQGDVVFEGVSFAYEAGKPVLSDIAFHAPPGSTTALVGSSGSGKSTLVGLVMAFHRPLTGRVLIDGRDLSSIALRDYRRLLGVVLQDNVLFDGTIIDNIRFSRPQATLEEVVEAGRIARCDEFVAGFTKQWETVVGERGVKLSGGQRQRIAIARAIIAKPQILVLDEATSSLDSESEAHVQAGLRELRRGRTTFVIAHRLSTIRSADQILVLEGGRIVERGTHDQLFEAHGRYRQLHDRQYQIESDHYLNPGEDPRRPRTGAPTLA